MLTSTPSRDTLYLVIGTLVAAVILLVAYIVLVDQTVPRQQPVQSEAAPTGDTPTPPRESVTSDGFSAGRPNWWRNVPVGQQAFERAPQPSTVTQPGMWFPGGSTTQPVAPATAVPAPVTVAPVSEPAPPPPPERSAAELANAERLMTGGNPDALKRFPMPGGWTNAIHVCNETGTRVKVGIVWQNTVANSFRVNPFGPSGYEAAGFTEVSRSDCLKIGFGAFNGPSSGYMSIFRLEDDRWISDEFDPGRDDGEEATAYGATRWICWPTQSAGEVNPDDDCTNYNGVRFALWFKRSAATQTLRITLTPNGGYRVRTSVTRSQ
jgi:hypothetical protein